MGTPIPIREDIAPATDPGRELLDFCANKIRKFEDEHGFIPVSIAMVL